MLDIFLRRILALIPTLLGVSLVSFFLIRLVPGDPVLLLLGERGSDPEVYQAMQANLGLDKPLFQQYILFLQGVLRGDFGTSIVSHGSVLGEFFSRFPATVELGLASIFLAILVGIPLGLLAALKRNTFFDYLSMGGALIGYSMPIFWWGLILILIFSVTLSWTPVSGRIGVDYDIIPLTGFMLIDAWFGEDGGWRAFLDAIHHLILPSVALATIPLAVIARMTRSSMLEVLEEDYIRTAKAKGLSSFSVLVIHALRNALIPVVTTIGLMLGLILAGAILTETIFSWPGIGKWIVYSINARDYPVIQGGILFISFIVIFINLSIDMLYVLIEPRMRTVNTRKH